MSRPKTYLLDWVFDPEADDSDERCDAVFRGQWECVAPLGHASPHWCPDPPGLPWVWYNKTPYHGPGEAMDD